MNQARTIVVIGCVAMLLPMGACTTIQAESYWGPAHKLAGLGSSYSWIPGGKCEPSASKAEDSDIEAAVQEQIDADLATKGYRKINERNADFSVCYRLVKQTRQREITNAADEAILEVDITEPATGGEVWRGRVRAWIDYSASPDARRKRIETAVKQIMKPLPKAAR